MKNSIPDSVYFRSTNPMLQVGTVAYAFSLLLTSSMPENEGVALRATTISAVSRHLRKLSDTPHKPTQVTGYHQSLKNLNDVV